MRQARSLRFGEYLVLGIALAAVALNVGRMLWCGPEWWGGRVLPTRDGGDFLAVLASHDHWRSPNSVIGVVLREQGQTAEGQKLIVPEDLGLLRPGPRTSYYEQAGGSVWEFEYGDVFEYDRIRSTTTIPLETRPYDPALDEETWAGLVALAEGPFPYETYYVAPSGGDSGVFVLHTDAARGAQILVPLELSPVQP